MIQRDFIETAVNWFNGIETATKQVFALVFLVNLVTFLVFIVHQPLHNHSLRFPWIGAMDQWEAGRWFSYFIFKLVNNADMIGITPIFCIAAKIDIFSPEQLAAGIHLVTVSVRRPALDALDPRVKSLNYLNNALAKREARLRGADEALVLNAAGMVAEASVANVFVVHEGSLLTPPTTDGALDGITRDSVLRIARELGIEGRQESLSRIDLLQAEEVFLTGSGARIVPVASLDGQPVGWDQVAPGDRPVTRQIVEAFPAFTQRHRTSF